MPTVLPPDWCRPAGPGQPPQTTCDPGTGGNRLCESSGLWRQGSNWFLKIGVIGARCYLAEENNKANCGEWGEGGSAWCAVQCSVFRAETIKLCLSVVRVIYRHVTTIIFKFSAKIHAGFVEWDPCIRVRYFWFEVWMVTQRAQHPSSESPKTPWPVEWAATAQVWPQGREGGSDSPGNVSAFLSPTTEWWVKTHRAGTRREVGKPLLVTFNSIMPGMGTHFWLSWINDGQKRTINLEENLCSLFQFLVKRTTEHSLSNKTFR